MDFAREWAAFAGASLALMGTALCAGARRHAEDNLAWRREWRRAVGAPQAGPEDARRLARALRAGGALGILAGLGVVAAAFAERTSKSPHAVPGDARVLGACFALLGACFAALSLSRRAARGPRFLASDPLAASPSRPLDELIAGAAGWLLIALWIWFGLRLLLQPTI